MTQGKDRAACHQRNMFGACGKVGEVGSRFVGVLAAYRDLPDTQWRYTVQLTPQGVTEVDLTLDQAGIHTTRATLAKTGD